jgi:uncharacterized phage protein (TIGR02220 family)
MAKRFTDTELWDKEWFMNLPVKLKCLVKAVRDKCDIAGIWSPNWRIMSAYVGETVTEKELLEIDGGNQFVKIPGGKIFCVGFIQFQYGEDLSEMSPVHRKILKILATHKIDYKYPIYRVQEKEEEKEVEEEKEKEEAEEKDDPTFLNQVRFIIKDLNEKAGTEYRPSSKATKALIRARLNDGFTLDDFQHVHSVKCMEWLKTEQEKYLRPETLYGTKFESYKNQRFTAVKQAGGTGSFDRGTVEESILRNFAPKHPSANPNSGV